MIFKVGVLCLLLFTSSCGYMKTAEFSLAATGKAEGFSQHLKNLEIPVRGVSCESNNLLTPRSRISDISVAAEDALVNYTLNHIAEDSTVIIDMKAFDELTWKGFSSEKCRLVTGTLGKLL